MAASILDASVLVELARQNRFDLLQGLGEPRLVPDLVDEELASGQAKHPESHARYAAAVTARLIAVAPIRPGEPAYSEYLRLRSTRTSPASNRGEDACIALALTLAGSVVFTNDHRAASKARTELADATRVRSFP